jgi:hypothetical protein
MSLFTTMVATLLAMQDPSCTDDSGRPRCSEEDRARVEALFDMPSLEAEATTGAEVYRARFVDGYGFDRPTVAFERRPGSSPRVVVYLYGGRQLSANIPLAEWEEVRRAGRFADRELVPLADSGLPPDRAPLNICFHSWILTVEMANSPVGGGTAVAPLRRRDESACGGALTTTFAFDLASRAIRLLPECEGLDARKYRSDVNRLETCGQLEGDRAAAASLVNQVGDGPIRRRRDLEPESAWQAWMGINNTVTLDWMGETYRNQRTGDGARASAFLAGFQSEFPEDVFVLNRFRGLTSQSVEVSGTVQRSRAAGREQARFTQIWDWDWGLSEWKLRTWVVLPFEPTS